MPAIWAGVVTTVQQFLAAQHTGAALTNGAGALPFCLCVCARARVFLVAKSSSLAPPCFRGFRRYQWGLFSLRRLWRCLWGRLCRNWLCASHVLILMGPAGVQRTLSLALCVCARARGCPCVCVCVRARVRACVTHGRGACRELSRHCRRRSLRSLRLLSRFQCETDRDRERCSLSIRVSGNELNVSLSRARGHSLLCLLSVVSDGGERWVGLGSGYPLYCLCIRPFVVIRSVLSHLCHRTAFVGDQREEASETDRRKRACVCGVRARVCTCHCLAEVGIQ